MPRARVDRVSLERKPGDAYSVWPQAKTDPTTGKDYELPYHQLFLDPYTGEKLGARKWGEVSLAKENILSFLYRLHMNLALPETTANLGTYILGITALAWTLDCFVGFYLTLPMGRKRNLDAQQQAKTEGSHQRGWWQCWRPAWLIKRHRFNYDLHRASGLWVWPMLFVLAWSSVALNLNEVYSPVMKTFLTLKDAEDLPALDTPLEVPQPQLARGPRSGTAPHARGGQPTSLHHRAGRRPLARPRARRLLLHREE